jgi:hypothetical protein
MTFWNVNIFIRIWVRIAHYFHNCHLENFFSVDLCLCFLQVGSSLITIRTYYLYQASMQRFTIKNSAILEQEMLNVSWPLWPYEWKHYQLGSNLYCRNYMHGGCISKKFMSILQFSFCDFLNSRSVHALPPALQWGKFVGTCITARRKVLQLTTWWLTKIYWTRNKYYWGTSVWKLFWVSTICHNLDSSAWQTYIIFEVKKSQYCRNQSHFMIF